MFLIWVFLILLIFVLLISYSKTTKYVGLQDHISVTLIQQTINKTELYFESALPYESFLVSFENKKLKESNLTPTEDGFVFSFPADRKDVIEVMDLIKDAELYGELTTKEVRQLIILKDFITYLAGMDNYVLCDPTTFTVKNGVRSATLQSLKIKTRGGHYV